MLAKRIFAGIFAVIVLLKLITLAIYPQHGIMVAETLLEYRSLVMIISLALIGITGLYIFSTLNLLDIAMLMLFTGFLISSTINPYFAELLKTRTEIFSFSLGKAWLPWCIWGALAVAVLYKVFLPDRRQSRRG